MKMIEVTTEYGIAKFDAKTLAEGLSRYKKDSECQHPADQLAHEGLFSNATITCSSCGKTWLGKIVESKNSL